LIAFETSEDNNNNTKSGFLVFAFLFLLIKFFFLNIFYPYNKRREGRKEDNEESNKIIAVGNLFLKKQKLEVEDA